MKEHDEALNELESFKQEHPQYKEDACRKSGDFSGESCYTER